MTNVQIFVYWTGAWTEIHVPPFMQNFTQSLSALTSPSPPLIMLSTESAVYRDINMSTPLLPAMVPTISYLYKRLERCFPLLRPS